MWPWGHLALAYLCYTAYVRVRGRHRPTEAAALLVALGSQTPDLVDKPFAWTLPVLPSGRSLAHSLVVVGPLLALAYLAARRRDSRHEPASADGAGDSPAAADGSGSGDSLGTARRRAATPLVVAFAFGTVAHALGDALYPLVRLQFEYARFLAWPALPVVEYDEGGFAAHVARLALTPTVAFELLLSGVALVAWRADGVPGLATVRAWSTRLVRTAGRRSE